MEILLDTHALIWYLEGDEQLSKYARKIIDDPSNSIYTSHISFYEIAIKMAIGKMKTDKILVDFIPGTKQNFIEILPIEEYHLLHYEQIPLLENHKDPFDRLLLAVALAENMPIITIDEKFRYYSNLIKTIW